jgi:hypothetical protein
MIMKTLLTLLILSFSLTTRAGWLVNFYPTNHPYAGLWMWPSNYQNVAWSTNTPGWQTNMTGRALDDLFLAQQPIFQAAQQSNNLAQATTLWDKIPAGLNLLSTTASAISTDLGTYTNVYSSLISETNTAPQAIVQIANYIRAANDVEVQRQQQMVVTIGLVQLWQQVGPVINQLYQQSQGE